jgi:RNA polymerase sigma-70 factor (ECF subfamily)
MPHLPVRTRRTSDDDRADSTSLTLIERVKGQDEDAWQRLVRLYTPFLRHWCRRWGVRQEDANDILQEVFQAVLTGLKDFRRDHQQDSFRGWLRGVARHKTLSYFRRRGDRGPGGTDWYHRSLLIPDPDGGPTPDEAERPLIGALYQDALTLVRDEFEERTWQAFWRAAAEGQSPAMIAADLGVTAAAVRQAKSRVLRRLKDVLGEAPRSPGPTDGASDPG